MKNYAESKRAIDAALKLYERIVQGYKEEKLNQNDDIDKFWDIYNCKLTDEQQYSGDAQVYEPIVRDCLEARRKRFTAMVFPNVGSNIEVMSRQGEVPHETTAILQRYVITTNLRAIVSELFLQGDVEGQWTLMLDWNRTEREVKRKTMTTMENVDVEDVEQEKIVDEGPVVTVVPAQDLWFFPATVSDIQDAEIVSIALRLTEDALDRMVDEGRLLRKAVDEMEMSAGDEKNKWPEKKRAEDAGVKIKAGQKFALVYMAFTKLKIEGKKRPVVIYYGGQQNVLGIVDNPHWSGRYPIISEPAERVAGTLWGKSRVAPVAPLQYQLNDITNMGMDSAEYAVLPIVMTDPLKNPRVNSMILGKAAIWETSPNDTKVANFPPLYQHAMNLRSVIKQQIMESMDVNEAMLGKAPQGRKNAQAIAAQSAEALATINDVVKRFEFGVMNQVLEWFHEMDLQFRDDELLVVREGEHGQQAIVESIPPQQWRDRYIFKWNGADQATGMQRIQQMIGFLNVLRNFSPDQLNGRRLDMGPVIDLATQVIFGPTLAANVLIDERNKVSIPPEVENEMLLNGLPVSPSPMDDDVQHIRAHQQAAQQTGDPAGAFRKHMAMHAQALQKKSAPMAPQPPGQTMGPRPGAMPGQVRGAQNPAGAIHPDAMADPMAQPRG